MKNKIFALIIALSSLLMLFSCGDEETYYPPVESTEEELETVLTLTADGKSYDVPYELYRAFFLQYRSDVDGGDKSVWSSDEKEKYEIEINGLIIPKIADIYAAFHVAEKLGIDLYSSENEQVLSNYIKASVEGGSINSFPVNGFGGNYDAYLESLKKMNHNYSTQKTLLRYSLASSLIDDYYSTNSGTEYTREDVLQFYHSDDAARFIKAYFSSSNEVINDEFLAKVHEKLLACESEGEAVKVIINNTLSPGSEVVAGNVIGTQSLDGVYYSELTEAIFALGIGEVSDIIKITTGIEDGYYIVYKAEKSNEHFEENYDYVDAVYRDQIIGGIISEARTALISSAKFTDAYLSIDKSEISMD